MRMSLLGLLQLGLLGTPSFAAEKTFFVGKSGSDAQQIATVESDADFENFTGRTHKVSGTILFDPAKNTGSGTLTVDAASIDTGIALRNEHMQGAGWLDTARFPNITFGSVSARRLRGNEYEVKGKFTLRGVTKNIVVRAKVRYLPESDSTRKARFKGDVLNVSTTFTIKLSDYGVKIPAQAVGKVAETVKITLSAFASTG